MEFNRQYLLILLLAGLLGAAAGYVFLGTDSSPPAEVDFDSEQSISDFSLTENRTEDEIWRLYSKRARKLDDRVRLENPRVVYKVSGETRAVVTAERGTYRLSARLLVLRDNVVLDRIPRNQVLKTSILKWDRESGMLETSARVRLEMPQGRLTASGMEAQLRKEIIRFLSDVEYSSQ